MAESKKTKKELIAEINTLKAHIARLENAGSEISDCGINDFILSCLKDDEFEESNSSLRSNLKIYGNVFAGLPLGMHLFRLNPGGKLLFQGANKAADRILGIECNRHIGETIEQAFPFMVDDEIIQRYRWAAGEGTPWNTEHVQYDDNDIRSAFEIAAFQTGPGMMVSMFRDVTEQKRIEEALQKSEERYRSLVDSSNDLIWEIDTRLKSFYVSPRIYEVLGYRTEEVLGRELTDFIPESDAEKIRNFLHNIIENPRPFSGLHHKAVHKSGKIIYLEASGLPSFDAQGKIIGIRGINRDITDRKKSEKVIKESEEKYRMLFESANDAIFVMDGEKFIDCNSKTLTMFGCKREDIVNKSPSLFSPAVQPDGRDSVEKSRERIEAAMSGNPQFFEWKHCRLDKSEFDAEVSLNKFKLGGKYYVLAIVRNITTRKRYEKELIRSKNQYHELFESVMEGLIVVDSNEIIKFCNPAFAKILDVEAEEHIIGKNLMDFIPEREHQKVYQYVQERMNGLSSQYELEIVSAKGNHKNILVTMSGRFDSENNHIGSFGAVMDITETKNLQELVYRAQRLETAGRIAGQIAHDFNNLLGPVTAYPEMIKKGLEPNHPVYKYVEKIEQAATQIAEINQELLVLGRRGHYNLEPVNLNEVIDHVINNLRAQRKGSSVKLDFSDNLMNVNGGKSQISRVIANLVANAWDASGDEGVVQIRTENYYNEQQISGRNMIPVGEYVKVTIKDNGCGIPDEVRSKIFEPFFTTKTTDSARGSGLGLSVVHAVMEDHNGHIDIASEVGVGTSFFLYFPITREAMKPTVEENIEGGNERILIVDDDSMQRDISITLLQDLGYEVEAVASGEQAIDLAMQRAYDLLILDMVMPTGIDGAETYNRILEFNPSQKAIIISGYAETERVKKAIDLGAGEYIRKPLTLKTIAKAVRNELDKKQRELVELQRN